MRDTTDEEQKLPCATNCEHAIDFGQHYPTPDGLIPAKVKHVNGKVACLTCKHRQRRERLLKAAREKARRVQVQNGTYVRTA